MMNLAKFNTTILNCMVLTEILQGGAFAHVKRKQNKSKFSKVLRNFIFELNVVMTVQGEQFSPKSDSISSNPILPLEARKRRRTNRRKTGIQVVKLPRSPSVQAKFGCCQLKPFDAHLLLIQFLLDRWMLLVQQLELCVTQPQKHHSEVQQYD